MDFAPFGIHPKSSGTIPKALANTFTSSQGAFQKVCNDSQHLPKSTLFKTMGYRPGVLVKIGGYRILRNSPKIFRNNPESSWKSICTHIGDISESLERFQAPTQIGPVQNHGLYHWVFGQNRWISEPSEFTPNLQEQSRKHLQIHLHAHRRHFRKFGMIPSTFPNRPCSKP